MLPFPTPLVVGFDGSHAAIGAAAAALDLAERGGATVHLVTVIRHEEGSGEARARRVLRDYTTALPSPRRRLVFEEYRAGDAAAEIAQLASDLEAGLLIVGTSHRTGVARVLLGSTVERLLDYAPCPMLIVGAGPHAWPPDEVVIGDDATPEARVAGNLAVAIGALYGAAATLLEAMPIDGDLGESAASWIGPVRELFEDRLEDRAEEMEHACGVRPTVLLVDGPAAPALAGLVGGARGRRTLVAVGTGRRAGLAGVLHPSVALAVAHAATGPVLISPVGAGGVGSAEEAVSARAQR